MINVRDIVILWLFLERKKKIEERWEEGRRFINEFLKTFETPKQSDYSRAGKVSIEEACLMLLKVQGPVGLTSREAHRVRGIQLAAVAPQAASSSLSSISMALHRLRRKGLSKREKMMTGERAWTYFITPEGEERLEYRVKERAEEAERLKNDKELFSSISSNREIISGMELSQLWIEMQPKFFDFAELGKNLSNAVGSMRESANAIELLQFSTFFPGK